MTDLVPRVPLVCSRCGDIAVHHEGSAQDIHLCAKCLIIKAAVATIQAKTAQTLAAVIAAVGVMIAVAAWLWPRALPSSSQPPVFATSNGVHQPVTETTSAPPANPGPPTIEESSIARSPAPPVTPVLVLVPTAVSGGGGQSTRAAAAAALSTPTGTNENALPLAIEGNEAPTPINTSPQFSDDIPSLVEVIVVTAKIKTRPRHVLALAHAPEAFRPYMSGRCVVLAVNVDAAGYATVEVEDRGGVEEFFVQGAIRDVSKQWIPAITESGETTTDRQVVRYCWK